LTKAPQIDPRLKDFRNTAYLVFTHLGFDPTPLQYELADFLQTEDQRIFICGYRGIGKSLLTSAFILHSLLHNPALNCVIVSASRARADLFSGFCMRLMQEMEIFKHMYPGPDQRNAKVAFDVAGAPAAHQPSVYSSGATGQLTGMRSDILIADDAESLNNSISPLMRERLLHRIAEFENLMKAGGRQIILGTPQSHESIYRSLKSKGFSTRYWPARYPSQEDINHYDGGLAPSIHQALLDNPKIEGSATDPGRFTDLDLAERQASSGTQNFKLQYQLNTTTTDADRWPLKLSDMIVHSLDKTLLPERLIWAADPDLEIKDLPCIGFSGDRYYRPFKVEGDHLEPEKTICAFDPSGRGKDESAICIAQVLNGYIFIRQVEGWLDGYSEKTLRSIAQYCKRWEVNEIIIENNFGDGAVTELMRPVMREIYPCVISESRSTGQKEVRIIDQSLEPILSSHRLVVDKKVLAKDYNSVQSSDRGERAAHYSLAYQISRINRSKGCLPNDDRVDVLAQACTHFIDQLAKDAATQMVRRKEELTDIAIEKFLADADGISRPQGPNWMTTTSLHT